MSRPETNAARKQRIAIIKKAMENGDKRSFTAIDADIELRNWTERFSPNLLKQKSKS